MRLAERERMRVVLVNMPYRPELLAMASNGRDAYQDSLTGMKRLRDRFGFVWLDYQAELALDDDDFRDVDHLNARGARKLSIRLARDLWMTE